MPYKLVHDHISRDTVEAMATLYEAARTGEMKGIAFAAMFRKNRYITNVAGLAYLNPTFARGCVMTLGDELAGLIHGRDWQETR